VKEYKDKIRRGRGRKKEIEIGRDREIERDTGN
jgi:hypothetical protein